MVLNGSPLSSTFVSFGAMPFMSFTDELPNNSATPDHSYPIPSKDTQDIPYTIDIDDTQSTPYRRALVRRMRTLSVRQEPDGTARRVRNTIYELSSSPTMSKDYEVNGQIDPSNWALPDQLAFSEPLPPTYAYSGLPSISYYSPTFAALESKSAMVAAQEEASHCHLLKQQQQQHQRNLVFYLCIAGLFLINFTCGFSVTATSTALPVISQNLHATAAQSLWIPGGFLLTAALFQPLFMRLSYIIGCKMLFLLGGLVFVSMSLISAFYNNNLVLLLVSRSIGGIGFGAIRTLTPLLITQIVTDHQSIRYNKYISLAFWLGATTGPALGGLFVEKFGLQSIFWLEFSTATSSLLFLSLLRLPAIETGAVWHRFKRTDYTNWLLLSVSITFVVGATSWTALTVSLKAWQAQILLFLGLLGLTLWGHSVHRANEPILPIGVFRDINATVACFGVFVQNFLFTGAMFLVPIYLGVIEGLGATDSGLRMLWWTMAIFIASALTTSIPHSWIVRFAPSAFDLKLTAAIAWLCIVFAMASTIQLVDTNATKLVMFNAALIGSGLGVLTPTLSAIVQTATRNDDETIHALPLHSFIASLGQCFGLLLCGPFFLAQLKSYLATSISSREEILLYIECAISNAARPSNNRSNLLANVMSSYTGAIVVVWWYILYVLAIFAFIASMLLVRRVHLQIADPH